jgi:hypothetical protein
MDHDTGRTEVRLVNINSFTYRSAYKFMIRMKRQHAGDSPIWERMAAQTRLSLGEFKARYGYLPNIAPQPADPSA